MRRYPLGQEMTFVILALISALALLSMHPIISIIFFIIALVFVWYEHDVYEYIKTA